MLVAASAEVPGPTSVGVRAEQLLLAFAGSVEVDALSLKGKGLTHIQRVGAARMMRVPVNDVVVADNTVARTAFKDRTAAFKRALARQLENDHYDAIICLDLFAAAAALPSITGKTRLALVVGDLPSKTFDARYQVKADDSDTRTSWELGERAALKAASLIVVPTRHAARILSERIDARTIRVFPSLVDTRVFQPPTVEVGLEENTTIAFLGGREGGLRTSVLTTAVKLLGARTHDTRFLFIGVPGRGDQGVRDALEKRGLQDRGVFVDTTTAFDVQQALSAADIAVVVGDSYGWSIPHRALEAMACGRPTVVAANDAACKDYIGPEHALLVDATAPEAIADAVMTLLAMTDRSAMKRAGEKLARRFDLGARIDELGAMLSEALGVAFTAKLEALEEPTQPAPVARAVPPTPLPQQSIQQSIKTASLVTSALVPLIDSEAPISAVQTLGDDVAPGSIGDFGEGAELEEQALDDVLTEATVDEGAFAELMAARRAGLSQTGRPFVPLTAVQDIKSIEGEASGDVWAGDTMLDPSAVRAPSQPQPERVKRAMLNTDSGSASVPRPILKQTGSGDEWNTPDTIADASPIPEPTKAPSLERQVITHPPKSFLVEVGVGDMTAEETDEPPPEPDKF